MYFKQNEDNHVHINIRCLHTVKAIVQSVGTETCCEILVVLQTYNN